MLFASLAGRIFSSGAYAAIVVRRPCRYRAGLFLPLLAAGRGRRVVFGVRGSG
ncbi:hypothetical protein KP014_05595 [Paenibacillus sophorae]|uniref:Uncharacterized protein n=1 Tax=Paenibacillus sophorae TaxID=1333845 RepID=A0ABX8HG11_9BACL|nr:hypothetical protein [Paenibacillus sophorae]QWU16692.1 hypothetical protein KP014_05595 [Paenibacillus sophorae]